MTIESELKLRISPESLARLKRNAWLRSLALQPPRRAKLHNLYFDTPELDLQRQAMALRLRRVGGRWIQMLKGGGGMQAGLHQRNEWESEVTSGQLDFAALQACGGRLAPEVRARLRPAFLTDFTRTVYLIEFEGACIELCMDSGAVRAGERSLPISELELELKAGSPRKLFELAVRLLDIVPLAVEPTNKAEYGYRLFAGVPMTPARGGMPPLDGAQAPQLALRDLVAAALAQVQSNLAGTLDGRDEEFLHQLRVGLRRLRVALAMALKLTRDVELATLHEEVAELCIALGSLREWDVFVTDVLQPLTAVPGADMQDLLRQAESRRSELGAALRERLSGPALQRLLLRFGIWMFGAHDGVDGRSLRDFAVRMLDRRSRQVARCAKSLPTGEPEALHELRIACKKLRYSAEMFASLFDAARSAAHIEALAGLQDVLGALNDGAVAHRLLDELAATDAAATRVVASLAAGREQSMRRLGKKWKRFAASPPFWR